MTLLEQLLKLLPGPMSKILVGGMLAPMIRNMGLDFAVVQSVAENVSAIYAGDPPPPYEDIDERQLTEGVVELVPTLLKSYRLTMSTADLAPLLSAVAVRMGERIPVPEVVPTPETP